MNRLKRSLLERYGGGNEERRHAWVVRQLAALPTNARVLDAGAGERRYQSHCGHLHYVSQDFGQYSGAGNHKGLHTGEWNTADVDIISDIATIPEPDASFDAVLCTEVLEHVPDPVAACREFARLVRPGGVLLLTAPFASLTHFAPYHYQSGFNRYFYEHWLPRLGFSIEEIVVNGSYFAYLGQELLRVPAMARQYSGRRLVNPLTLLASFVLLRALARLARVDRGSGELLCFGFHVRAKRSTGQS